MLRRKRMLGHKTSYSTWSERPSYSLFGFEVPACLFFDLRFKKGIASSDVCWVGSVAVCTRRGCFAEVCCTLSFDG